MKVLIAAFLFAASALAASAGAPVKAGQPMPGLKRLLPGAAIPNTAGKVVLVDFWASWCGPCRQAFPCYNRLHAKYASKGLVIIGVGVDDDPAAFKAFARKMKAEFTVVHDDSHKAAEAFAPPSMPTCYIIDRKGVIRSVHRGFHGAKSEAEYVKEIESLLAAKP